MHCGRAACHRDGGGRGLRALGEARAYGTADRADGLSLTRMQKDLLERLPVYSARAAEAYEAALHVYHGDCYAGQPGHLAYALRDVVDHLAREKQNDDEKKSRLDKDARMDNLRMVFDPVTRRGYAHDEHYLTLVEAYYRLSRIAHEKDPVTDLEPFDAMSRIERALHDLSFPQTVTNMMIDKIISKPPALDRAKDLIGMISTGASQSRIIDRLPLGWLESMDGAGFFRDPEKYRAAHRYLFRCAGRYPGMVAGIISKYDPGDIRSNHVMYGDFLDCALRMPVAHAASVSRFLIAAGLDDMFVHYPDRYLKVAAKLCDGGEGALAMEFARRGLSPANIDYQYPGAHWLDGPVREFVDATMNLEPLLLFGMLADLLDELINQDVKNGVLPDVVSSMSSKRPTIEESNQNVSDLQSSLVEHMRECLKIMGKRGRSQIRRAMAITGGKGLLVYRRLEMFTYDAFPGAFKKEMEYCAVRYLGDPYMYHEHYSMLGNHYCSMSARARKQVSDAITGQDTDDEPAGRDGDGPTRAELRQLRYFECIEDCLDDGQRAIYDKLVKKYGKASHPGYVSFRGSGRIQPERGPGPLKGKDAEQAIDIVKDYEPDSSVFPDRTLLGFSYLASASPEEFSKRATDLAGADPSTQASFFRSMGSALKDGKRIDWGGTLRLLEHVSGTRTSNTRETTALAACSMLEDAFQHAPPGFELRGGLWSVIESFVRMSDHASDDYLEDLESSLDSDKPIDILNTAINTLEGRSFFVMMLYALWCHDNAEETKRAELVPEVRDILDQYIGGTHTVLRDGILGSHLSSLYFFDKKWTLDMVEKICTSVPARIAFWDGYVRWNYTHRGVFSDLRHMYDEFLTGCTSEILKKRGTFKSTLVHSLLAYLYRYDSSKGTFERFLKSIGPNTPDDVVSYLISKVEVIVHNIQDQALFDTKRLENLWKHKVLSKRDLTYWFVGSKVKSEESIRMYVKYIQGYSGTPHLLNPVLKELKSHMDKSPKLVLDALLRLLKMDIPHPSEAESVREMVKMLEGRPGVDVNDIKKLDELLERALSHV